MLKSPEDLSSADSHHQNGRGEGGRVGQTAYSLAMGGSTVTTLATGNYIRRRGLSQRFLRTLKGLFRTLDDS